MDTLRTTSASFWHKQNTEPLFGALLWARPETRAGAGKLLIAGGNTHTFATVSQAFAYAEQAGIGVARTLLPNTLHKILSHTFPGAEYAPSNPSGGFAATSLAELLAMSEWAEGVLLPGDIGRNSETLAMLEHFISSYHGPLTVTHDIADFLAMQPQAIRSRSSTLLVVNLGQLQRLGNSLSLSYAFTSDLGIPQLVEHLHSLTETYPFYIITRAQQHLIVACEGEVSTTPLPSDKVLWMTRSAATAITWWIQNPSKPFAAFTTSTWNLSKKTEQ